MSNEAVSIRYPTLPAWLRIGLGVLCVGLTAILILDYKSLIAVLPFKPNDFTAAQILFVLLVASAFVTIAIALAIIGYMDNTKILFRAKTIKFPATLIFRLKGRLTRLWDEIKVVQAESLPEQAKDLTQNTNYSVSFLFNSGESVRIDLPVLSNDDQTILIKSLVENICSSKLSPRIYDSYCTIKHQISSNPIPEIATHTNLWEEEFSSRFVMSGYGILPEGQTLQGGRYKIISVLSTGNISSVYLAKDTSNEEIVVLKESYVPTSLESDKRLKLKELFNREAMLLSKLSHQNISQIRDFFTELDREFLVIDHIPGISLKTEVTTNGPMDADRTIACAIEIADIINYLHSQNPPIIHRDITPDNLIIDNSGKVCLIDFGAANEFLGQATGTIVGKQAYIAPEQFRGKADKRSDIYALACTMHFLLTGQEPEALMVSEPIKLRPDLPVDLDNFIATNTNQNPDKRAQSSEIFITEINKLNSNNELRIQVHG